MEMEANHGVELRAIGVMAPVGVRSSRLFATPDAAIEEVLLRLTRQEALDPAILGDLTRVRVQTLLDEASARGLQLALQPDHDRAALVRRLKQLRERAGLAAAELARAAGISGRTLHKLEAGDARTSVSTLVKVAAALDASLALRTDPESPHHHHLTRRAAQVLDRVSVTLEIGEARHLDARGDRPALRVERIGPRLYRLSSWKETDRGPALDRGYEVTRVLPAGGGDPATWTLRLFLADVARCGECEGGRWQTSEDLTLLTSRASAWIEGLAAESGEGFTAIEEAVEGATVVPSGLPVPVSDARREEGPVDEETSDDEHELPEDTGDPSDDAKGTPGRVHLRLPPAVGAKLRALAQYRGLELDAAILVAIAEDYTRLAAALRAEGLDVSSHEPREPARCR
ncbi:MAG: helix-turn-helix domain-containing protein [Nannocystaceae bacterium]